ncbi:MAG: PIN domain-containing protein [Actinomycetaceae bacterium]|nr:PIN domain-containing protein [Actinomycetaceae bacterium]MDU0970536.1 PIN domain-containing protein [Actinomycetaceae bacterium]
MASDSPAPLAVVDACVIIALLGPEGDMTGSDTFDRAHGLFRDSAYRLVLPVLQKAELLAVAQRTPNLPVAERRQRVAQISELVDSLGLIGLDMLVEDAADAWQLWADYGVKYQDGLMVCAAARIGAKYLFTLDEKLVAALRDFEGVHVSLPPSASTLPLGV